MSNEVTIVVTSRDKTDFSKIGEKARTSMQKPIQDGLDDVEKTTNERFREIGDESGHTLGDHVTTSMKKPLADGLEDVKKKTKYEFGEIGNYSGQSFTEKLDEHLRVWSKHSGDSIDVTVKEKFREVGDHGGKSLGTGLEGALKAVEKLGDTAGKDLGNSFGKSLGGAFETVKGAWIPLLIAALLPELPAIGALAATALVFAFGAGLAGLGLIAAWHLKSVKKEFGEFKKFAGSWARDIGRPFEETWATIFNVAGNVLKKLQPVLKGAFKDFVAPAVTNFVLRFGEALTRLGPAIRPVSEAFAGLLGSIGDSLPGIFDGIAKSFISMSETISQNPDLFAGFISGLLQVVVGGLKVIAFLSQLFAAFSRFEHTSNPFTLMLAALSPLLAILLHLGVAGKVFHAIGDAAGSIGSKLGGLFDKIKEKAGPILKEIGGQIKSELVPAFAEFLHSAAPLAGVLVKVFTPMVVSTITDILHAASALLDLLSGFLKISGGLLSGNWSKMWDGMKDVAKGGAKIIGAAVKSLLNSLTGGHGDKAVKITLKAVDQASGAIHGVINAVKKIVNSKVVRIGVSGAGSVVHAVASAIKAVNRFVGKTVHIGQSGAASAASAVAGVIRTINRLIGKVVHIGVSGAGAAVRGVQSLISIIRRLFGKTVRVGANVFGLGSVRSLIGAIGGVVSKTVNIVAHRFGFAHGGVVGGMATGGISHAAGGGPRGNTVLVGEQGPELVNLPAGSRVRSNPDTRAALAAGGGASTVVLELRSSGARIDDFLLELFRNAIRVRGGNVQVVLGK